MEHVLCRRKSTFLDSHLTEIPVCTWSHFNQQLLYIAKIYRLHKERAHLKTHYVHYSAITAIAA